MGPATLQDVLATHELAGRFHRIRDVEAENRALVELARGLPTSPDDFLQKAADVAMVLCRAQSTGVSLLEEEHGKPVFRWHAVSGGYASNVWGTMPKDLSPCGAVIDRGTAQLMKRPARHFTMLHDLGPEVVEALLAPLEVRGRPIGVFWLVSHQNELKFAPSDAAALQTLADFIAPVYDILRERTGMSYSLG